jgi:GR25 family glycosyltransferase involved in LPS biosynthesis
MTSMGIFAINLDRSPDRWKLIEAGFSALPWALHRVRAVDGRDVAATLAFRGHKMSMAPDGVGWSYPRLRMVSVAEEACFCSHLAALRQFLDAGYTHALILEDDARIVTPIDACVRDLLNLVEGPQIAKLSGSHQLGRRAAFCVGTVGQQNLVRSFQPASNTAAYMVTRESAERIIARAGLTLATFDDFLSAPSLHGCEMLHVSPWVISNKGSGSKSTLTGSRTRHRANTRRGPLAWLLQAWRRAGLRLGVWRDAARGLRNSRFMLARWA